MPKRAFRIAFGHSADHALDYLLGMLADTRVTTLQRVEQLTAAELHWQYQPGWNTVGALLAHLAANEHYFRIVFVGGRPLTAAENERWLPALDLGGYLPQLITHQPIEHYVALLAESRQQMLAALQGLTFVDFTRRLAAYDPETGADLAWVLYHLVEDEIYHRGQISLLLKLYQAAQPPA
ncbi:DinB family protein [Hymenobacter sp. B81]|uniref:DinB family protein n=1 Tax=Hymenobacter sp. B81 TaxID=3344878 RepID=UPI0037DC16CC